MIVALGKNCLLKMEGGNGHDKLELLALYISLFAIDSLYV